MSKRGAPKRYERDHDRLYRYINYSERGQPFIPQWRMRQIRWEEGVTNSQLKRDGKRAIVTVRMDCHCGSMECICHIYPRVVVGAK